MREVEYRQLFEVGSALRVRFILEQGRVLKFVVQLECLFEKWHEIIRYDTAHGYAHCDIIYANGERIKIIMKSQSYNESLSFALKDLTENWQKYRQDFEQGLRKS